VTSVADAALQKLLQSKMTLSNLSVSSSNLLASTAPLLPSLAKCLRRYRLIAIKLVSAIEKNPESIRSAARDSSWNFKEKLINLNYLNNFPLVFFIFLTYG
jgi:hypothetical protein